MHGIFCENSKRFAALETDLSRIYFWLRAAGWEGIPVRSAFEARRVYSCGLRFS